ncbi:Crp/Fnr family transcriptional regulator [Parasulfuritortus cantonensis]|uniref:Crp/Fnr family transcriptional regulator n=1 Tax=Parasulfuritortus cantonensis TaxID=2528202 RepID=A0A4R1BD41_9PROT|nr:Crp/Fnr family transcriptional regulator [Parasulfuritortus cantonensis]TCJ14979.1 Crp/Fnr family transcriptional regulator [Parasulfuritortus cantonensis]
MSTLAELQRFEPFRSLSEASRAVLARGLVQAECPRAGMALHKGQPVSGAYVVLSGRLRVFALAPNGTEATLYFIDPGETCVLALNCLFNDLLYPAWVQAEANTTIALIPGAVYRTLFEREPAIQNLTVHTLSTLVFRLMSELELVHSSHHRQRLANFILIQAAADGVLRMTQQQLAQHLGTTREVIARLLQEFVGKGLVDTRRGAVTIRDLFGLRRLVTDASA